MLVATGDLRPVQKRAERTRIPQRAVAVPPQAIDAKIWRMAATSCEDRPMALRMRLSLSGRPRRRADWSRAPDAAVTPRLPAEAPVPLLEGAHGAEKIDMAEGGPEHVGEIEFAPRTMP